MKKKILLIVGLLVVVGGVALVGIYFYGFRLLNHPTASMANTIVPGEKIAATRFFGEIKRGDLLVFKYPRDPHILYLKRVIGLPGETIAVRGKNVFINGQELAEKRIKVDLGADDPNAEKPLRELGAEGAGEYRVFYDKTTWEGGATDEFGMNFAVQTPFIIPAGQYFMLGDSRDNSQDSRFWGPVAQDAILWKAYLIYSSPDPKRIYTKLQ
jgi:signal peptidase I